MPRHRFMAAYEQKVEPPDRKWQYLLFAAEPYETIAFKVSTVKSRYNAVVGVQNIKRVIFKQKCIY